MFLIWLNHQKKYDNSNFDSKTFYDNSNFVPFFNSAKKKIGLYKLLFRFSCFNSIPRIPTQIPRIPIPFFTFPAYPARFPPSHPHSCILTTIPCNPTPILHIFLTPFPDSPLRLLQIAYKMFAFNNEGLLSYGNCKKLQKRKLTEVFSI